MNDKEIFAANLTKYMELHRMDRNDICNTFGFNYFTVTDWVKGRKLPRMDKIKAMADYFGITVADLVEEYVEPEELEIVGEQATTHAALLKDKEAMDMLEKFMRLSDRDKKAVTQMIDHFLNNGE